MSLQRIILPLLVILAALAITSHAHAAYTPRSAHVYQTGKTVKGLQWLLQGRKPSKRHIKTYTGRVNGRYDHATSLAVKRMKWKLGWPDRLVNGRYAGRAFFAIVKGKRALPLQYMGIRSKRLAAAKLAYDKQLAQAAAQTTCAQKLIKIASGEIGVTENPWGSNRGARVSTYQSVTGAYGAAWCVSFYQWVLRGAGKGPIADRTAGVFYLEHWAQSRGWVHARPVVGAGVSFMSGSGHQAAVVTAVTSSGFYTIEGNHNNGVYKVFRRFGDHNPVFVYIPGCS